MPSRNSLLVVSVSAIGLTFEVLRDVDFFASAVIVRSFSRLDVLPMRRHALM